MLSLKFCIFLLLMPFGSTLNNGSTGGNLSERGDPVFLYPGEIYEESNISLIFESDNIVKEKITCDSSDMLDHQKASPPRLLVLGLVALLIFIKTIAKLFPIITKFCPESSLFVVFGIVSGIPIAAYFPTAFNQEHFFDFLLPMIVLEASYYMSNYDLMRNLKKILTFAVIGTFINMVMIGGALEVAKDYYGFEINIMHLLVFATILSAVDPVAVICVFEDIGVNANLYINVFGESLLNDGVSVVFFRLFAKFATENRELSAGMLLDATLEFFKSAIFGTVIGLIGSVMVALATKYTYNNFAVQPIYVIFIPYCVYLFSEFFHISGIISLMICVICFKPYTNVNLTYESKNMVEFIMKSSSSCSESYIFMFLGISVYQVIHNADLVFCTVSVAICIIARFITVFFLSFFVNIGESFKLSYVDQFVMAYGGLRGAVCFGLVMSLDGDQFPCKQYFASSAIVVIVFTIFVQGMSIKKIVEALRVKLSEKHRQQTRFEVFGNEVLNQIMDGVLTITGRGAAETIFHWLRGIHDNYLTDWFWVEFEDYPNEEFSDDEEEESAATDGDKSKQDSKKKKPKVNHKKAVLLNVRHEAIEKNEAFERFKKFGSFAALPAEFRYDQESDPIRKSQSMCQPASPFASPSPFICGPNIPEPLIEEIEPEPTLPKSISKRMPRNMSDRKLLTAIFENQKTIHSNLYSRHFSDNRDGERPSVFQIFKEIPEETEMDSHYNTVPDPRMSLRSIRRKPIPNFNRRQSSPKAGSTLDRPTFFMGGDHEHDHDHDDSKVETGMVTFKTGRFQVAKQSPSHSAREEAASLLKIDEEQNL